MVQGRQSESDSGQHRSADRDRSRRRARLPRGLSRPSCAGHLQRGSISPARLGRVFGGAALCPGEPLERGRRQFQHRSGVPARGTPGLRDDNAVSARGPRPRERAGTRCSAPRACRSFRRAAHDRRTISRRRDRPGACARVDPALPADVTCPRRTEFGLHRALPFLRDQLCNRRGPGPPLSARIWSAAMSSAPAQATRPDGRPICAFSPNPRCRKTLRPDES